MESWQWVADIDGDTTVRIIALMLLGLLGWVLRQQVKSDREDRDMMIELTKAIAENNLTMRERLPPRRDGR